MIQLAVPDLLGNIIDLASNGVPGAVMFEADLDGDGTIDDGVHIATYVTGSYLIQVTAEASADPADAYTLVFTVNGLDTVLAQDETVPQQPVMLEGVVEGTGDLDFDGDVDLIDFARFRLCFDGGSFCPIGANADFDNDGDVDLIDYATMLNELTGP